MIYGFNTIETNWIENNENQANTNQWKQLNNSMEIKPTWAEENPIERWASIEFSSKIENHKQQQQTIKKQ